MVMPRTMQADRVAGQLRQAARDMAHVAARRDQTGIDSADDLCRESGASTPEAKAATNSFCDEVSRLHAARGWSLRELARRVPCDAGYLSKLIHGHKNPSLTMAARLEELLGANGRLVACLPSQEDQRQEMARRMTAL
jgi:ribosome-binding protein aMBF1 (putative translation factor)